jgi:carboxypeptidase PM20D1
MKKIIKFILWLIALVIVVILIKTLFFKSLQIHGAHVNISAFRDESLANLSKATTFRTISYSPDSPVDTAAFKGYHKFIEKAYPLVNSKLEKEIFNDFSLLYRWKGSNASLKPMILMAHMDVVPAGDTASWEHGAFSGDNDGTYIWGRGTLDDKAAMISILETVERLLSEGFLPERTIYLSFGHDEELGGTRGAKVIAGALKDRGIEAEYVLDEGMAVTVGMVPMMKKPVALIGTSEKGYLSVRLSVDMPGGHSSTPERESAIILLNRAIYNAVNMQMKPKISGPVNDFIRYLGPEMPFFAKAIFANKWIFKGLLLNIYSGSASGNALVRTTASPTIFKSGYMDNVIPSKAEAVINFRILPGETTGYVLEHLAKIIGDKRVKLNPVIETMKEPAPVSASDTPGFRKISATLSQIYPEAVIAPTLVLGGSDSRNFTLVTNNTYRFMPIVVTSEDMARIHGLNERTKIEDYLKGLSFYYQLIKNSQSQ